MSKRIISALLLPVLLVQFTGCMKQVWVPPEDTGPEEGPKVHAIRTVDGEVVNLDGEPRPLVRNDTLHAHVNGRRYSIAVDRINSYRVERTDAAASILVPLAITGVVLGVLLIMALEDFGDSFGPGR